MGFSAEAGYIPLEIDDIMDAIMAGVNSQFGTSYTSETFVGTGFYKFFYALAQRVQTNEIKASEIFLKVQTYFQNINAQIASPRVTPDGVIETMAAAGYVASVKPVIDGEQGEVRICVDPGHDGSPTFDEKAEIGGLVKSCVPAGIISIGSYEELITLSNGQQFGFQFSVPFRRDVQLQLTITLSRNNQSAIADPEDTKQRLLDNIAERYGLGRDFEPERYFTVADAPWASDILLEYKLDGDVDWRTEVYEAAFDDLLVFALEDIEVIEE